ncbi:hypothetical protein BDF22DRAFT_91101 [Syncephalis plumigaleata]|nr:hypothetical protein BDF22DRAFT_91101 [Syncephalis plumigaleata]
MWYMLLVIILASCQYINAHVTFTIPPKATDQNTTESTPVVVTYPTYDYFQASRGQEQYRESGVFLPMQMSKYPKPCSLRLAGVIPASRVGIKPATSTIMGIREEDVREVGCLTIAQVVENINEFNSGLVELGYPPVKLVLYLMAKWINEDSVVVRGGPYSEPYQARNVGIPDGTPAIPMALVLPDSTKDFMVKQRVGSSYQITVDVKYEPGPWNSIFTSPTYYAFIYILVGLNAGFVFYGLVAVGKLIAAKQLKLERRNVIFAISVTSTLLFITTLPMPIRRQTSIVIGQFSTVLFTLAFYLLLYTW